MAALAVVVDLVAADVAARVVVVVARVPAAAVVVLAAAPLAVVGVAPAARVAVRVPVVTAVVVTAGVARRRSASRAIWSRT